MRKLMLVAFAAVMTACLFASPGVSNDPDEPDAPKLDDVATFMRVKLHHSQKVIEGLALEDYDMIAKSAQELSLLSQAANWRVLQTPQYLDHSSDFRRSADALKKAATEKNLDGAALAYFEVTLKCVNCHKYVRSVKMAEATVPGNSQLVLELTK